MMFMLLGGLVMLVLRLLRKATRRRGRRRDEDQGATVQPAAGLLDPGGIGWARDPISGKRDRVTF